jgi:DNA-binding IclR family transcriptional regulator
MQRHSGAAYLDAQELTDVEAGVYEAIATLEYSGRPVTVAEIVSVTGLGRQTVRVIVDALAEQGVLAPADALGGVFRLARRDWSATPETPSR